jgi:hypothetical protein
MVDQYRQIIRHIIDNLISNEEAKRYVYAMYEHKEFDLKDLESIENIINELKLLGLLKD